MQNNKGTYFLLLLSYVVWILIINFILPFILRPLFGGFGMSSVILIPILIAIVNIALYLWITPCINISTICFYEELTHKNDSVTQDTTTL